MDPRALPRAPRVRRAGQGHRHRPGLRTRQRPRVTTRLAAASYRVAAPAARDRRRWPVATGRAPLNPARPRVVGHGPTVPGGPQELTGCALGYTGARLAMWPSATRPHIGVERRSFPDARRWRWAPRAGGP